MLSLKPRLVQFLLSRGANPNFTNGKGMTPVSVAATRAGRAEIFEMLVTAGADMRGREIFKVNTFTGGAADKGGFWPPPPPLSPPPTLAPLQSTGCVYSLRFYRFIVFFQ